MKRIDILIAALLGLVLLGGCTLSMDEFADDDPAASLGKDSLVEITSEMGTVSYQFNDNVTLLTDKALAYLDGVANDSILYFRRDLPERYRPRVGTFVAASPSERLPFGLSHRVLAFDEADGQLRMVLTTAQPQQVFKERKVKVSFDYVVPGEAVRELPVDSSAPATRAGHGPSGRLGIRKNDSVFIDMRYVRKAAGGPMATRAEGSALEDTVIKYEVPFDFSLPKGPELTFNGNAVYEHAIRYKMEYEEDLNRGYRRMRTVRKEYYDVTFGMSVSNGGAGDVVKKDGKDFWQTVKDTKVKDKMTEAYTALAEARKDKRLLKKLKESANLDIPTIWVPIPKVPCVAIVINLDASIGFTATLMGSVKVRYDLPEQVTGWEETGDVRRSLNQRPKGSGRIQLLDGEGAGSVSLSAGVGAGVGVGLGSANKGVAGTANVGFEMSLTANLPFDVNYHGGELMFYEGEDNFNVALNVMLSANVKVFAALSGKKLGSVTVIESPPLQLADEKFSLAPRVRFNSTFIDYESTGGNTATFFKANYKITDFKSGYLNLGYWLNHIIPMLFIYPGTFDKDKKNYIMLNSDDGENRITGVGSVVKGREYTFTISKEALEKALGVHQTYTLVPVLRDELFGMNRVLMDKCGNIGTDNSKPTFSGLKVKQTYGQYDEESRLFDYEVEACIDIRNAYLISDWGFEVIVQAGPDNKRLIDRQLVSYKPGQEVRSGLHKAYIMFSTNFNQRFQSSTADNLYDIGILVRPYYKRRGTDEIVYPTSWSRFFLLQCPMVGSGDYTGEYDTLQAG